MATAASRASRGIVDIMAFSTKQYLLVKLAEEATEVAQMALKTAQFGPTERYPKSPLNNEQRLSEEYTDMVAIVDMLLDEGVKISISSDGLRDKKRKVSKWRRYSIRCEIDGLI